MTWSYRVVKQTMGKETRWAIHEVFYSCDSDIERDERPRLSEVEKLGVHWTEDPVGPEVYLMDEDNTPAEAVKQLRTTLELQLKSLDWPIVDGDSTNGMPVITVETKA